MSVCPGQPIRGERVNCREEGAMKSRRKRVYSRSTCSLSLRSATYYWSTANTDPQPRSEVAILSTLLSALPRLDLSPSASRLRSSSAVLSSEIPHRLACLPVRTNELLTLVGRHHESRDGGGKGRINGVPTS